MRIGNLELNTDSKSIIDKLIIDIRKNGLNYFSKGYKDTGEYLSVQCPYHKMGMENHPSAQFRKSDALFYCFGCKTTHSIIDVVTHCLNVNGKSWLLENFDGDSIEDRKVIFDLPTKKIETPKYIDKEILKEYRFTHPYMFERKLNIETIRKFDIGYDKDFVLQTKVNGQIIQKHIGECITFPVRDEFGNILFIARRAINQKFFHYHEGVDKPIYGLFEIYREMRQGKEINEVYVCESMLDALVIHSWGKYAVALNGTGSKDQYNIIKKSNLRYLILATDNDDAGKRARELFKKNVTNKIIREIDYSSYENCKDINDMSKEQFLAVKII